MDVSDLCDGQVSFSITYDTSIGLAMKTVSR
jgi:hypothetical protein